MRRLIEQKEGVKANCFHDMQIKCTKETHYDQNMPFFLDDKICYITQCKKWCF